MVDVHRLFLEGVVERGAAVAFAFHRLLQPLAAGQVHQAHLGVKDFFGHAALAALSHVYLYETQSTREQVERNRGWHNKTKKSKKKRS